MITVTDIVSLNPFKIGVDACVDLDAVVTEFIMAITAL
jgi:hypothetical protein